MGYIALVFGDVKNQNFGEFFAIEHPSICIPNGFKVLPMGWQCCWNSLRNLL